MSNPSTIKTIHENIHKFAISIKANIGCELSQRWNPVVLIHFSRGGQHWKWVATHWKAKQHNCQRSKQEDSSQACVCAWVQTGWDVRSGPWCLRGVSTSGVENLWKDQFNREIFKFGETCQGKEVVRRVLPDSLNNLIVFSSQMSTHDCTRVFQPLNLDQLIPDLNLIWG